MRLRNSVALPRADQLVFAAICSAAETIWISLMKTPPRAFSGSGGVKLENYCLCKRHIAAYKQLFSNGSRCCQVPAFSTASIAALDAPQTEMVTLLVISPLARTRTPSNLRRTNQTRPMRLL